MDETPTKPPEIREKPRTGCVVFLISAATGLGMSLVAILVFDSRDERQFQLEAFGGFIMVVGIIWSVVLMPRARDEDL